MFDLLFGWRKASICKKLMRRVQCRLKLLKNKRSSVVKQLREDVAQLLKNGHHQAAFDRVEQVVLEESMVQMYDLLYQFCEFLVIKLPYIRKHRDCPDDINEAVSTLIFSSARFGELPELLPIRKLLRERYGRKFMSAALELLPGNLVNHQIVENLDMKKVPDNVKHRFVDEIARSCIQTRKLLVENKPMLACLKAHTNNKKDSKILWNEDKKFRKESCFGASSENSAKLGEEEIYQLDDIEELMSPVIKDGNVQDQRLFVFKSFGSALNSKTDDGIDIDAEEGEETASWSSWKSWRNRSRRLLLQENLDTASHGDSHETSSETRPKCGQQREREEVLMQKNQRSDEKWEVSTIEKCSSARPCYFCGREVSKAVEAEESSRRRTSPPSILRATNMSCERPKDSNNTDNKNRSNSFGFSQSYGGYLPCRHIHPKLPDCDELAAKFMELKRAALEKK